jgi:hypothetical protein
MRIKRCADCFDCVCTIIYVGKNTFLTPRMNRDNLCKCKQSKWLGLSPQNKNKLMEYRLDSVIKNTKELRNQFKRC